MPLPKHSGPSKSPRWVVMHLRLVVIWLGLLAGLLVVFWMISPQRIAPNPEAHAGVGKPLPYLELLPLTGGQPPVGRQDLAGPRDAAELLGHLVSAVPRGTAPHGRTPAALRRPRGLPAAGRFLPRGRRA